MRSLLNGKKAIQVCEDLECAPDSKTKMLLPSKSFPYEATFSSASIL